MSRGSQIAECHCQHSPVLKGNPVTHRICECCAPHASAGQAQVKVAVASHSIPRVVGKLQRNSVKGIRGLDFQAPAANVGNGKFGTRTESHAGRLVRGVARKALVRALRSVGLSRRAAGAVAA